MIVIFTHAHAMPSHEMPDNTQRITDIDARLRQALTPGVLEIIDESHLHVGHAGAQDGRGHFRVRIQSDLFAGLPRMAIHRKVYRALGPLMQTDIHALTIEVISQNDS